MRGLLNGALSGQPSLPGLGSSVSFHHDAGGIPGESSLKGAILLSQHALADGEADNAPPGFTYFGEDGGFTYEAFIKPELSPQDAKVIALTILSMDGEPGERIFSFRIERQGFLTFNPLVDCGAKGGAMALIPTTGPHAINTTDWFHVAVTYNGFENTTDNLTLYWTRIASPVSAANSIGKGSLSHDLNGRIGDLAIGNEAKGREGNPEVDNAEAEPFLGCIDEVRISSVARHPTDFAFVPPQKRVSPEQAMQPANETRNTIPFSLRLARVLIDGKQVEVPADPDKALTLESGLHRLDFDFGPPLGLHGSSMRVRSQLVGVDERWIERTPGMSLRCQVLDDLGSVISETAFDVVGTSPGWIDRPEDSMLAPRSEPVYIPAEGRKLRVILASGTPETTGSFVIDDLQFSLPGQLEESFLGNSDFRKGENLTSPAGVPEGWKRGGHNPAIAKVVMFMENPTRNRSDSALALVDGEQTGDGYWEAVHELDPANHGGKTLIVSWGEAYNIIPGTLQRATYVNVPPGNYTFRAIGLTSSAGARTASISLPIHIPPPFWSRAWFWPLIASGGVVLLALGIQGKVRRHTRRKLREMRFQHDLERDRTRIARDMHDDLGTRISVLTSSASLASHALEHDPGKTRNYLDRLKGSARELVVAMDDLVWAVDPAHDSLDQFASHLTRLTEEIFRDSHVRVRLDIPAELPPRQLRSDFRHHLALATKEGLHNILKHAGACEAYLSLRYDGTEIVIEIRDTGRGFEVDPDSRGHGRGNLAGRLREIGGICTITSEPGSGTLVRFQCPLPNP